MPVDMSLFNSILQGVQTGQQGQQLALKKRELDDQAARFAQELADRKANTALAGRQEDRLEKASNWEQTTKFPAELASTARGQDLKAAEIQASLTNTMLDYNAAKSATRQRLIDGLGKGAGQTALGIAELQRGLTSNIPGSSQTAILNFKQGADSFLNDVTQNAYNVGKEEASIDNFYQSQFQRIQADADRAAEIQRTRDNFASDKEAMDMVLEIARYSQNNYQQIQGYSDRLIASGNPNYVRVGTLLKQLPPGDRTEQQFVQDVFNKLDPDMQQGMADLRVFNFFGGKMFPTEEDLFDKAESSYNSFIQRDGQYMSEDGPDQDPMYKMVRESLGDPAAQVNKDTIFQMYKKTLQYGTPLEQAMTFGEWSRSKTKSKVNKDKSSSTPKTESKKEVSSMAKKPEPQGEESALLEWARNNRTNPKAITLLSLYGE